MKQWLTIDTPRDEAHTRKLVRMSDNVTLGYVARSFVASKRRSGAKPEYRKKLKQSLDILKPLWNEPIKELSQRNIRICLEDQVKRVSWETYIRQSHILADFFEFAKGKSLVLYNFVRAQPYKRKERLRFFTRGQLDLIFKALPQGRLRDACLLIYHTGMKTVELNQIKGVRSMFGATLFLKRRSLPCSPHLLGMIERYPRYNPRRIPHEFRVFMFKMEFAGDISYLRNSHFMRLYVNGTPHEIISKIHDIKMVENKFKFMSPSKFHPNIDFTDYL